jgi:hypothetical protein
MVLAKELKKIDDNIIHRKHRTNQIVAFMKDKVYGQILKPYFKDGTHNHI